MVGLEYQLWVLEDMSYIEHPNYLATSCTTRSFQRSFSPVNSLVLADNVASDSKVLSFKNVSHSRSPVEFKD